MSTDDSPEREFNVYDSEGLPAATLEREESTSNISEGEAISNLKPAFKSNGKSETKSKPHREVW